MQLKLSAACGCNIGKRRDNNEDNFYFNGHFLSERNSGLCGILAAKYIIGHNACFCVFDGMGGEEYGELASFAAASALDALIGAHDNGASLSPQSMENICNALNDAVCARASELSAGRMGTTMAMLFFTPDKTYACNIGDSRIYALRSGKLSQISEDHVEALPSASKGRKPGLTQYLGVHRDELMLEPFICEWDIQKGDMLLICSDGLTDMLSDVEIHTCLKQHVRPQKMTRHLIDMANRNGGRDNITVLIVKAV